MPFMRFCGGEGASPLSPTVLAALEDAEIRGSRSNYIPCSIWLPSGVASAGGGLRGLAPHENSGERAGTDCPVNCWLERDAP